MLSKRTVAYSCWTALVSLCFVVQVQGQRLQDGGKSCRLLTFIPFTDSRPPIREPHNVDDPEYLQYGHSQWPDEKTVGKAGFSMMATAEMARRHFNERNPVIVKELASDEMKQCDIQIPDNLWYMDSSYSREKTVRQIIQLNHETAREGHNPDLEVCGVVGPVDAQANEGVAVLTEARNIPQFAYATIEHRLSRAADFPTFRRLIPRGEDFSWTIAQYIQRDIWERDFVAIIYDESDYGEQFEDPLEDAEDIYCYHTMTEGLTEGNDEKTRESLQEAKDKGFRTVVLITNRPSFLNDIAKVADEMGMLEDEFFWLIVGDAFPPALDPYMKYEVGSPTDKLLRGSALFTNYDRFVYQGESDPFLQAWRQQDPSLVQWLNKIQPRKPNGEVNYIASEKYFAEETPTLYSSFLYDAVITAGMSVCKASNAATNDSGEAALLSVLDPINSSLDFLTPTLLDGPNRQLDFIGKTTFQGASGPVSFYDDDGEIQTSRNVAGVTFGIYNVRPGPVDSNNMRGYEKVLTSVYSHDSTYDYAGKDGCPASSGRGAWKNVEGTEFFFSDDSTDEPQPKAATLQWNFLSDSIQALGLFLICLALLICIGSAIWVYVNRKSKIVKASQPEFIYLLCMGSALVAWSAFFVSFDEQDGYSPKQLSSMCAAFPWFFVLGYLCVYSALYAKLWRLSQLMQMRRRAVGVKQVLLPFVIAISATVIILVIWQIVDPYQWQREVIALLPLETFGECGSETSLYFMIPIVVMFVIKMSMTAVIAWRLKDVQAELAESRWIFYGIFTHLQVWALGIPMIIITDGVSKDAQYLMYAALCFIFSTSLVVLVVWPKIFMWVRETYYGGNAPRNSTPTISVTGGPRTKVSGLRQPVQPSTISGITNSAVSSAAMSADSQDFNG